MMIEWYKSHCCVRTKKEFYSIFVEEKLPNISMKRCRLLFLKEALHVKWIIKAIFLSPLFSIFYTEVLPKKSF